MGNTPYIVTYESSGLQACFLAIAAKADIVSHSKIGCTINFMKSSIVDQCLLTNCHLRLPLRHYYCDKKYSVRKICVHNNNSRMDQKNVLTSNLEAGLKTITATVTNTDIWPLVIDIHTKLSVNTMQDF